MGKKSRSTKVPSSCNAHTVSKNLKSLTKIKVSRSTYKESPKRPAQSSTPVWQVYRYCGSLHPPRQCPAYGKACMECNMISHFQRVCSSKKTRAVHEVEQETVQDKASEDIEMVSVNSVQFDINQSVVTTTLKTLVGQNSITIPYKIEMGSNSNKMPIHIFKKHFPGVTNEQLTATVNICIL